MSWGERDIAMLEAKLDRIATALEAIAEHFEPFVHDDTELEEARKRERTFVQPIPDDIRLVRVTPFKKETMVGTPGHWPDNECGVPSERVD